MLLETSQKPLQKLAEICYVASVLCVNLTVSDMSSVSSHAVLHHREAGQEASYDRRFCCNGLLQCWNHISPNFTGVCVCVCDSVCVCVCYTLKSCTLVLFSTGKF